MVVISVSLSGKDLKDFDSITEKMGYSSRSDAVREAFQNFISENRWREEGDHKVSLLITLIYDDSKAHRVLDLIHDHSDAIHSSSHTHMEHKCIDQLILEGCLDDLNLFLGTIAGIKDVRVKKVMI